MRNSYVALLRGINVGTGNRVSMQDLKTLFVTLGFTKVRTYINSGNVLFVSDVKPDVKRIEKTFLEKFGFYVSIIVIDKNILSNITKKVPLYWTNDEFYKTDVAFLFPETNSQEIIKEFKFSPLVTILEFGVVVVWHISREEQKKSKLDEIIKHPLYKKMTIRNINTVRKLALLIQE